MSQYTQFVERFLTAPLHQDLISWSMLMHIALDASKGKYEHSQFIASWLIDFSSIYHSPSETRKPLEIMYAQYKLGVYEFEDFYHIVVSLEASIKHLIYAQRVLDEQYLSTAKMIKTQARTYGVKC